MNIYFRFFLVIGAILNIIFYLSTKDIIFFNAAGFVTIILYMEANKITKK